MLSIAYIQWNVGKKPHAPVIGTAWVADGDSLEIAGTRLRLEGIDAPELDQACADDKGQSWSCGRAAARELRSHLGRSQARLPAQGGSTASSGCSQSACCLTALM